MLTQRKSSQGEEQEGDQGRTLWLCWVSYHTPVTPAEGFLTRRLWMGCSVLEVGQPLTKDVESLYFWELVGTTM